MNLTVTKKYDNWLTILKDLSAGTLQLNSTQAAQLRRDSEQWPSCACGQLCSTLPRHGNGRPIDAELASLGMSFFHAVEDERWTAALNLFNKIEARSTTLVNEIEKAKQAEKKRLEAAAIAEANAKQIERLRAERAAAAAADRLRKSTPTTTPHRTYGALPYHYNGKY